MSGVLTRFSLLALSVSGTIRRVGSSIRAAREVTITPATDIDMEREFTIAAGGHAVLYDYDDMPDFNYLSAEVVSDGGFCYATVKKDAPTSSTNKTPAGTAVNWHNEGMSCFAPKTWDTQRCKVNPVLADAAGDTGGLPTIMSDAGTVDGYIYKVVLYNPGTEDVTIRRTLIN